MDLKETINIIDIRKETIKLGNRELTRDISKSTLVSDGNEY